GEIEEFQRSRPPAANLCEHSPRLLFPILRCLRSSVFQGFTSPIIPLMDLEQKLAELKRRDSLADAGGGKERQERQHKEGKMSARERIEFLLDEGTFEEFDKMVTHNCTDFGMEQSKVYGDGFVTGYGRIEGRLVFVF